MVLALGAEEAAAEPSGVERLSATGSIRFAVTVPPAVLEPVEEAPGTTRLALPHYENLGSPGAPALPSRIVFVAVPPEGPVRIQGAGFEAETIEDVTLAPQPVAKGTGSALEFLRSPEAYARQIAPGSARLIDVTWLRNQRVARVAITPAEYDPVARRLRLARRVEVEVVTSPAAPTARRAESLDPFEDVYREVLVNYEQGMAWRRPASASLAMRLGGAPMESTSVFVGRSWVKIAVPSTGFYRVDFGALRLLELFGNETSIDVDSLRLFAWPGYPVLSERGFCDTCDYREVAIGIVDDGDGKLDDNDDGFYFFALGASDWADLHDPAQPDTVFVNHPYETRNYYYLTISTAARPVPGPRRRIPAISGTPSPGGGEITPITFTARAHFEVDSPNEYWPNSTAFGTTMAWEKWFWSSIEEGSSFGTVFDLPGADTTQAARLRMRLWGLDTACPNCTCEPANPPAHETDVVVNGTPSGHYRWGNRAIRSGLTAFTVDTTITGLRQAGNTISLAIPEPPPGCESRTDLQGLAWFDFFYPRRFEPHRDVLEFDSPEAMGDYLYRIGPFSAEAEPLVFDVTDPHAPMQLMGGTMTSEPGGRFLAFEAPQAGARRYRVIQDTSIVELTGSSVFMAPTTSLVDLRNRPEGGRYVVIHWDGFAAAAETLVTWRRSKQGLSAVTIPVSAIYDQFSGGRTDPGAIRDMLRAAFLRWPEGEKPVYVTLLGDASYDFKNYLGEARAGQPGTLVPSYESGWDSLVARQYATDDWMLNAQDQPGDVGPVPDFFGGRLPAEDAETAMAIVREKVLAYERTAPFGEHRNRIMLIADDNLVATGRDGLGWAHVAATNQLDAFYTPWHIDRRYIYLHTYPTVDHTKPGTKPDILETLHDGVVLCNYIGHGSPFQLTDERVFVDQDVSSLRNADKLPLFIAASCDVGKFNDPKVRSLGELLLTHRGGGAIGVISATELAFAGRNAQLNSNLFIETFERDPIGRYHIPVSETLVKGKLLTAGIINSQKYQLLGDAATVLNLPRAWAEVTLHDSSSGPPVTQLAAGRTMIFKGTLLDRPGGSPVALDGVASILIEDSKPSVIPSGCEPDCPSPYSYYAGTIFRGDALVSAGRFEGRFVVPMEARQGNRGRFRVYASGTTVAAGPEDGAGAVLTSIRPGTAPAGDHQGPRITLSFEGGATIVRGDALLKVTLSDPSGILTTGHSPQNAIVVTIDDNSLTRVDITPTFRYAAGSHESGTATFRLPGLPVGPHRIRVSAADNLASGLTAAAHRATATLDFEVQEVPPLSVAQAILFPNPVRSGPGGGGQFVIDAPGDPANVLLRIYTVSGRLIRVLKALGGQGQIQIPWDGLDEEGHSLANGVYLFKVNVNAREADGRSSARQHADAEGRFVVVRR